MKILLLGGTGFLGTYLREHLSKNHELDFTYANNPIENGIHYKSGISSMKQIEKRSYDVIVNNINPLHLSYEETIKDIENIVSYCQSYNSKLIQISSIFASHQNRFMNRYNLKKALVDDFIQTELSYSQYVIVRYTQIFDSKGLSRASQAGLYYLLKQIKQIKPISIFSNHTTCYRNYMPVELAVNALEQIINHNLKGVFNAHLDNFTLSLDNLINRLTNLNIEYRRELISVGENIGLTYHIEKQSDELILKMDAANELSLYFRKAYQQL